MYGGMTQAAAHEVRTRYQGTADVFAYAAIYSVKSRKFVKGRYEGDEAGGEIVYRLYPGVYIQFSYEYRVEGDPWRRISMTMFRLKGNGEREALKEATIEFRDRAFLGRFPEQVRDFFDARPGYHRPPTLDAAKVYGEEEHRRLVELLEGGGRYVESEEGAAPRSEAERADYAHVIERMRKGLREEIELFRKTLEEIKKAWETVPERYVYIPKREKVLVRTYEDVVAPGGWASVDGIAYREEEREYYEMVERPEYKREIREWRERMRPLAERAAALLRLFPVKCRGAGYMRYECSDGTIEDYDWFEFRKGSILGALGVSVEDYQKVVSFVKFVLEGEG